MPEQSGDLILRHKHPRAVEAAFRRKGSDRAKEVAERPKKSRSNEENELLNRELSEALPEWLSKLEKQIANQTTAASGGRTFRFVKEELFERWARKSGVITQELSDSEYYRIVAPEHSPRSREEILKELQEEQLTTYGLWLEYLLVQEGRRQYEPWFRYLVLSDLTKRDDRGRRRDLDTTSGVLPFSAGALARIRDDFTPLINTYLTQEERADSLPRGEEKKEANRLKTQALNALTSYPFHEKYLHYLAEEQRAANEKLGYADGWHTFTDAQELADASRGTPWCLAGISVAQGYLSEEDAAVRVYFKDGRPHIGIHVVAGEVREVRGADDSQNLNPEYAEEVEKELSAYDNASTWRKQAEDARKVGTIFAKLKEDRGAELTILELRFLYGVDSYSGGFGYIGDPRFGEIVRIRDPKMFSDLKVLWPTMSKVERNRMATTNGGSYLPYISELPDFNEVEIVNTLLASKEYGDEGYNKQGNETPDGVGFVGLNYIFSNLEYFKKIDGVDVALRLLEKGYGGKVATHIQKFNNFDPNEFIAKFTAHRSGEVLDLLPKNRDVVGFVVTYRKEMLTAETAKTLIDRGFVDLVLANQERFLNIDINHLLERQKMYVKGERFDSHLVTKAVERFSNDND